MTEKDKNYQGYFTSRFKINASGKEAKIKCYVCENVRGALLGRPALMALELLQIKLFQEVSCSAVADEKRENELVKEYPKLFTGLGRIKGEPINIKMEEGVSPYHLSAPRRVAIPLLKQLEEELNRMEELRGYTKSRRTHRLVSSHGGGRETGNK